MTSGTLYRRSAFTTDPNGGNPAGVWVGEILPPIDVMQRIATEVGYSETAFVAPMSGPNRTIRYYSPEIEVAFCGHATIATGVVLGETEGDGTYHLATAAGEVQITVRSRDRICAYHHIHSSRGNDGPSKPTDRGNTYFGRNYRIRHSSFN